MTQHRLLCCLLALALAACGDEGTTATRAASVDDGVDALPGPAQAGGSVTGMPDGPGPGSVPLGGVQPGIATVDGVAMVVPIPGVVPADAGLPPLEDNPEAGLTVVDLAATTSAAPTLPTVTPVTDTTAPPAPMQTGAAEAVAVVGEYYAAINGGQHARAYAMWSDGGRSSGQTPDQFAAGFAGTRSVIARPGQPGAVEGAAGSQYVEVPVSVTATRADGSERRYVGAYVLRRAMVDGASATQRSWRIASAELREYQP